MSLLYLYLLVFLLSSASCRLISKSRDPDQKQLFVSQHVVTESGEFHGGVLVNGSGIIEAVLKKDSVQLLIAQNSKNIEGAKVTDGESVAVSQIQFRHKPLNYFSDMPVYSQWFLSPWKIVIIDAGGLALMAGIVDSHVHVNEPGRTSWEGYVTATQAAASGGITTIIDMPLNSIPPTTTLENLKIKANIAKEEVFVDVGFWGGVVPGNEMELRDMVKAGVVGFKCFLSNSGVSEFPYVTAQDLENTLAVLNGTDTVLAFHAELELSKKSPTCEGSECPSPVLYSTYLASRPAEMEIAAASLIASQLPKTDVHVHVVHVSAEGVVPILERAREERIKTGYKGWRGGVTAETCNHYLTLSSEEIPPGRTEFKCAPPIRNNTNKQKLWEYIRDKRLDLVTSDHSPSVASLKGVDFLKAWGGISSVQFDLPLFWTQAKARGYSLSTVSHYLSAGPARLCGLQERKGALRPGLDADFIVFDPNASFVVTPDIIRYKNKISPYMNRVLTGKVMQTYVRGKLVYADGELIGDAKGKLLLNEKDESASLEESQQINNVKETIQSETVQNSPTPTSAVTSTSKALTSELIGSNKYLSSYGMRLKDTEILLLISLIFLIS